VYCYWLSPAQTFLVSNPVGTRDCIFVLSIFRCVLKCGLLIDASRGLTTIPSVVESDFSEAHSLSLTLSLDAGPTGGFRHSSSLTLFSTFQLVHSEPAVPVLPFPICIFPLSSLGFYILKMEAAGSSKMLIFFRLHVVTSQILITFQNFVYTYKKTVCSWVLT
jgi:hypothetical protein